MGKIPIYFTIYIVRKHEEFLSVSGNKPNKIPFFKEKSANISQIFLTFST